jgi:hypothetical protein
MIAKEFDAIAKADIESLVSNSVAEGRSIEYKQQLPGGSDEEKREFLADVSSFANAGGGDLIYGIVEKRDAAGKPTGTPEQAEGLAGINTDAEIRRLDEIIRAGIDPRIPGIRVRSIDGFPSGPLLLIRIPKSWAGPHMVIFKNLSRFFSRTSALKYQLDVREIRNAFTASADLRSRIAGFRTERLGKIIANEGPVVLPALPKVILHLVPLSILDSNFQVEVAQLSKDYLKIPPLNAVPSTYRHNLDGILTYTQTQRDEPTKNYLQVFRSGVIESVACNLSRQQDGKLQMPAFVVEQKVLQAMVKYNVVVKELGVSLPIVVMLSLHGFKNYRLWFNSVWYDYDGCHPIDRDTVLLPDVLLEDFATPPDTLLRPVFDALWQAAGFANCANYGPNGRWGEQQA